MLNYLELRRPSAYTKIFTEAKCVFTKSYGGLWRSMDFLGRAVVGFGSRSSRVSSYCYSSVCRDDRVEHVISRGNGRISQ